MSNLYNIASYKNKIINLLLKNEAFIKLINPEPSKCNDLDVYDVLLGGEWMIDGVQYEEQGHVFDHNFVDDTIVKEKTFVFVETDISSIRQNILTDFNLYICIFTYKNLVRITDDTIPCINDVEMMGYNVGHFGNRIDILCDVVDRIINRNIKIKGIGDIEPAERDFCTIYSPSNKYYGKCLKYKISNYNETGDNCGY